MGQIPQRNGATDETTEWPQDGMPRKTHTKSAANIIILKSTEL